MKIQESIQNRILLLDGGLGTSIQKYKLEEKEFRGKEFEQIKFNQKGNNDILCLTQPDIIKEVHRQFLEAGADIIATNSFNSNKISQADYGLQDYVYRLNKQAAILAKEVTGEFTDKPRYVGGSIGPSNRACSISPDVNNPALRNCTFDELKDTYKEQALGLIDGGVDILLIETVYDTLNAKAALYSINEIKEELNIDIPVLISATIADKSGRILSGQTLEAFLISIEHANVFCVSLNCSFGAKDLIPHIETLSKISSDYTCCYPNAGLPNQFGEYDETPETMAEHITYILENKLVNIIGGCCGTTPEHIKAINSIITNYTPRTKPQKEIKTQLAGLNPLTINKENNFVNIGERTNVAGSRKFARLIKEKKYDEAVEIARNQIENGAQLIDINLDDAMLDAKSEMTHFVNLLLSEPEIAKVPFVIDSSDWEVLLAGLKCIQGKTIVNSISLKEGETEFIYKAKILKKLGAAILIMAFDEKGQADTLPRRKEICQRAYKILTEKVDFNPENIFFDPNVLAIGTGIKEHNSFGIDFINTVEWIKKELPHAKTSAGVSNLSFSFRGNNNVREAIHSVFLYHAINKGLDVGIVNPGMIQIYSEIDKELLNKTEDLVLNKSDDATEKLIEYANQIKNEINNEKKVDLWRTQNVYNRIQHSFIKGLDSYIEQDIIELKQNYPKSIEIIEGPLMDALKTVGDLFAEGKMFLPQIVKSARVMKKAVAALLPYIEQEKETGALNQKPKIIFATVKGDVHDIGKNIVKVVLSCNNFEVIDLGVMVPTEKIVEAAITHNADIVALSGLITPSLSEIENVALEMEKRQLSIPIMIGGATTSIEHTAVRLFDKYSHPIIHVSDASAAANIAKKLLSKKKVEYINSIYKTYEKIKEEYSNNKIELVSLNKAKENASNFSEFSSSQKLKDKEEIITHFDLSILKEYINWNAFFYAWNIKGEIPEKFNNSDLSDSAKILYKDAQDLLVRIIDEKWITANAIYKFFPVKSNGNDLNVYNNEDKIIDTLHFFRQQEKDSKHQSLVDYFSNGNSKSKDYIGMFAITTGIGVENKVEEFIKNNDDYSSLLLKTLSVQLAEAFSKFLHNKINTENSIKSIRPAIGYAICPDHSEKATLWKLLNVKDTIGVELTQNYMMNPQASVCGYYIANEKANYFNLKKISKEQLTHYAQRKNVEKEELSDLLGMIIE